MQALFLDLDHTLVRPLEGRTFPKDKYDWEFLPGIIDGVKQHLSKGEMVIIITNQGGIEARFHTEADVTAKISFVVAEMVWQAGKISCNRSYEEAAKQTAYYFCPTNDKEHPDRKPNPGMILRAAAEYGIDLASSLFVGDMDSDRQAAEAAGVPYCHVDNFIARHAYS